MNLPLKTNAFYLALLPIFLIAISILIKLKYSSLFCFVTLVLFSLIAIQSILQTHLSKLMLIFITPLIVFVPITYCFLTYDGWYTYGWHNFLQLETIYSWVLDKGDLNYYNQQLAYPYYGLIPLAQLSYWAKTSPLNIFLVFNLLCFIAWFSVYLANFKSQCTKYSVFALLFFFTFIGLTYFIQPLVFKGYAVDLRASPFFCKFMYIDAMVIGIPSLAIQYYFSKKEGFKNSFLSFLFGLQVVVSYPLLGPSAILVSFSSCLFEKKSKLRNFLYTVFLSVVLLVIIETLKGTSMGPSFYFEIHLRNIFWKSIKAFIICALPLLLLALRINRDGLNRDNLQLVFIACVSIGLYDLLILPMDVQYKFLYGAVVVLGFATVEHIAEILARQKLSNSMLLAILLLGLISSTFLLTKHVPNNKTFVPLHDNGSFFITSKLTERVEKAITESKYNKPKKVLISDTAFPLTLFLRLPEYFNLYQEPKTGYGMTYTQIVLDVKRNSAEDFKFREQVATQIIFGGDIERVNFLKSKLGVDEVIVASDKKIVNCPRLSQDAIVYSDYTQKVPVSKNLYLCFY